MPGEDDRGKQQQQLGHQDDPYIEALERFKKRSFATFGLLIFLIAMAIAIIVEGAGAKKIIFDSLGIVHADSSKSAQVCVSP